MISKITYNISPILSGKSLIAEFKPKNRVCDTPSKCRIQEIGPTTSTCVYYSPIYDGYGNNLNSDRNKITRHMKCSTCGKEWTNEC